jgi:alpha-tubulin suppressor-like RCC1 family protein
MKRILLLIFTPIATLLAQNLQISGGNNFSAAVCDNQKVFVWGANSGGQLGTDGTGAAIPLNTYRSLPRIVEYGNISNTAGAYTNGLLPTISQVDAGSGAHILGLGCAGQVWGWGENNEGQLGRGSIGTGTTPGNGIPSRVLRGAQAAYVHSGPTANPDPNGVFLSNITYVSGGNNSSFAVEGGTTRRVLAWGANDFGQLGNGTTVDSPLPVYVKTGPGATDFLENIIQIEGGDDCTYALDAAGNVWSWGKNAGNELGRPNGAGTVYAARVRANPAHTDNSQAYAGANFLSGIIQISGGDTHALALGADGSVWSWGGDWGVGQLGQGNGYQSNPNAGRVVNPGVTATTGPFLGSGTEKAVYVAASQAGSAVVLSSGRVVTFGANGLFNNGATATQSGSITCPPLGTDGEAISGGALGTGVCNGNTCVATVRAQGSEFPVYVKTGPGATDFLTGITQVSDGDAWFYALGTSGTVVNTYVWGWNRRGELGLGTVASPNDYSDRCYATSFTLPSGCAFAPPCPGAPTLPDNFESCPIFSTVLNSQVPQTSTFYKYTWFYRATLGSGIWTVVESLGDSVRNRVSDLGEYKVEVSDSRASVPSECGPCPVLKDSLRITPKISPYTVTACWDITGAKGEFKVLTPTTSKIKWYTTVTGGTALNPSDSNTTIISNQATVLAACGNKHGLFAEDLASVQGTLFSANQTAPTAAQIATATGCATGSWGANAGNDAYLAITPNRNLRITSVSFYVNNTNNYVVAMNGAANIVGIYSTPGTLATGVGTSSVPINSSVPANSATVISVAVNWNLTSGTTYYIRAIGDYNIQPRFNCNIAAPIGDNTGQNILSATGGSFNGASSGRGSVFNINFETGTGYDCSRILVCENNNACTLPVSYIYFNAIKVGKNVNLSWSTAHEDNTKAFAIYRSFDNVNFVKVGEKSAKFNGHSYNDYDYTDHLEVNSGNAYYRIVEIDIFGANSNESNTASVNLGGYNSSVSIAPNPNAGSFRVSLEREADLIDIKVVDLAGKQIHSQIGTGNSVNVNLGGAHKGVYLIYVFDGTDKWVEKIVVE